jgi:hypothetical protein
MMDLHNFLKILKYIQSGLFIPSFLLKNSKDSFEIIPFS